MNRGLPAVHRIKLTLSSKFALLFAVTFLFWGGNGLVVLRALSELNGIGETINLAGSLRWRSQQLEAEALRIAKGLGTDPAVVASQIKLIAETLQILQQGGDGSTGAGGGVPEARLAELAVAQSAWEHLRLDVEQVLTLGLRTSDAQLSRLHVHSRQFLAAADTLVANVAKHAREVHDANRVTLYKLGLADVLAVIVVFLVIRMQIVRPLLALAQVTRDFSMGQYGRRSGYRSHDEIGLLAESFDQMADETQRHICQIEGDLETLRRKEIELRKFSEAIAQSPNVILITDAQGTIEYANPQIAKMTGYSREEVIGKNPRLWQSGSTPLETYRDLWETISSGSVWRRELLNRKKNGELFWESITISPLSNADGEICNFVAVMEDITERKNVEHIVRLRERAIASSTNGIIITKVSASEDNPIISANPAFTRMTGYAEQEVMGRNPRFLLRDDWDQPDIARLCDALRKGTEARVVLRNYRKDGTVFWNEVSLAPVFDESGRLTHFISVFSDVTERMRYEAWLEHRANHDELTGLPNRNLMRDRVGQAIARAHRSHGMVAVAFADLDNFKYVNDSLGHLVGDELVKAFAARLVSCVREIDTVARLGGDEFVLVLCDVQSEAQVSNLMARILDAHSAPYVVGQHEIHATCSIGASLYPRDGTDSETLLRNADTAMYRAKEAGRNRFAFYEAQMNVRVEQRIGLEAGLRHALARQEFFLEYQPKIDLRTGAVVGAEALLRWRHPQWGLLSPARFVPVAEETGLILAIGEWVIDSVCAQQRAWREGGLPPLPVAVNLSASQFRHERLLETVGRALHVHGLERTGLLEMEITESMLMEDVESALPTLGRLKQLGIALSLDDFGTGYSSLAYLKRFPFDHLKIDRAFVRDLSTDPDDAAICRAIINLAHNLKRTVIAEGVETEAQMTFLRTHHCDQVQGYLYCRPLPANELALLLRDGLRVASN